MKNLIRFLFFVLLASFVQIGNAATTMDPANPHVYGANIGWVNAEADGTNGAVIGQAFCSGYVYSANTGWIHLGDGSPADGIAYGNASSLDYGINHDGHGNLSGYAYGANIGWVTFEQTHGQPKVSLMTGDLSGYAYGANVGWINLSGAKTLSLDSGPDSDGDTIPDAWEYGHTNTLIALDKNGKDSDGDGVPDTAEYGADTDPFDSNDYLRITRIAVDATTNQVSWPVTTSRMYTLQHVMALTNPVPWQATGAPFIPPGIGSLRATIGGVTDTNRFYRVQAELPLGP